MACRSAGFTLLELAVAVAVLVLLAGILSGPHGAGTEARLGAAAVETASALRFARTESLRTGRVHGVRFDSTGGAARLRVFYYTTDTPPVQSFGVLHPVDRSTFDVDLASRGATTGVAIASASFSAGTSVTSTEVAFDATGAPVVQIGTAVQAMTAGDVVLSRAGLSRTVSVDPGTGRVSEH